jgi:hypothetical protein
VKCVFVLHQVQFGYWDYIACAAGEECGYNLGALFGCHVVLEEGLGVERDLGSEDNARDTVSCSSADSML